MELNWKKEDAFFVDVTPPMALVWLQKHNEINRVQRETIKTSYSRDMESGRFAQTGESISFDWNGQLINGQHRLEGVFKSGKTIRFLVVTGLDPAVRPLIDIHGKRSIPDGWNLSGHGSMLRSGTVTDRTGAGMWARIKNGISQNKGKETRAELLDFALANPDGGIYALREFGKYKLKRGVVVAGTLAAVARASYYYKEETLRRKLSHFVEVLCTGIQQHRDDEQIINLREILTNERGDTARQKRNGAARRNSNSQFEVYGKTCRVIQAYMRGEVLGNIRTPNEDPFPLQTPTTTDTTGSTTATPRLNRVAGGRGKPNGRATGTDALVEDVLATV